jgi:hypothetical protein
MISTTIKQSEDLLSAGLDQSTADMVWEDCPGSVGISHLLKVNYTGNTPARPDVPAWSMTALWEICRKRNIALDFLTVEDPCEEVISAMVKAICKDFDEEICNNLKFKH